jgi:hypothetical protein
MTSVCSRDPVARWGPYLAGKSKIRGEECLRHTGLLPRLGWLREACDAGEAVEAGVEGQDLFDSVSFHYRQVDGVASGHLRVA